MGVLQQGLQRVLQVIPSPVLVRAVLSALAGGCCVMHRLQASQCMPYTHCNGFSYETTSNIGLYLSDRMLDKFDSLVCYPEACESAAAACCMAYTGPVSGALEWFAALC
jgi:hypothetical protein